MTLEEAVEVLEKYKHNGCPTYYSFGWGGGFFIADLNDEYTFSEFEAVAIAEKYEREKENLCSQ
jgi:hypothetical protein